MFEMSVGTTPCDLKPTDFKTLGQMSEGYSGSDISIAVQDALMQPVRKIQTATHYKKVSLLRLKIFEAIIDDTARSPSTELRS